MKYGRLSPDYTKPRLWLEDYVHTPAMALPGLHSVDYCSKVTSWPMYLNNEIGDCTAAAALHAIGAWTEYVRGSEAVFTDEVALRAYEAYAGYVPGDPATDHGAVISDVMSYWHNTGFGGHKISAYAQLKSINWVSLSQALQLFGSVYLGIQVPESAEQQFAAGEPWEYVKGSPVIGGHAIVLQRLDIGVRGDYTVITWGKAQRMTLEFARTYVEEAWVALSPDWLNAQNGTITGLDIDQLTTDMQQLSE